MPSDYYFTVNDTEQFNVSFIGNLTGYLTDNGGGLYSFNINYTNTTANATVAFLAKNMRGSASMLAPQLQICACINGGMCTQDGILNVNQNPLLLNCKCLQSKLCSGAMCIVVQFLIACSMDWRLL